MEKIKYIHLHNHSEYSLLDGICKITDLVEAARLNDMPALGLTDHGNMFGAIKFYKECIKYSIIPVIGCEFYLAPLKLTDKQNHNTYKYFHLILFAKNYNGYKNLLKLNTIAYRDGFYFKPRIDRDVLKEYSEDLICTSACVLGDIPQALLSGNTDEADKLADFYRETFNEDYYIELNNHKLKDEINVRPKLIEFSKRKGIPLVAANDVHYIKKEDSEQHNILIKINSHSTISDNSDIETVSFENDEFYFKNENEMVETFVDIPEALENTKSIALKCKLELSLNKKFYFPDFKCEEENNYEYLKKLCYKNLEKKYQHNFKTAEKRLEHELKIIKEKNFQNYFLIIADLIDFAAKNNILTGPGRGSAAGSIVSYLLNITKVDPLKYHLLFERFLNKSRKKMPDIDLDFEHLSRDKLYEYLENKYGKDNVSHIITYGTFQLKNAIRDVSRVYEIKLEDVQKLLSIVGNDVDNLNIEKLHKISEYKLLESKYPDIDKVIITANKIIGIVKHISMHPAGIIISPKKIYEYLPLYYDSKTNYAVSQYDMHSIEDIGLLKIDILAIKTLTVIHETIRHTDENIVLDELPLNDKKVYRLFSGGNTLGIFQFESDGIRKLLIKLQPKNINDIIDILSLYRPGVLQSGMVDDYIKTKNKIKPVTYLHNDLEKALKSTYGLIIYQEQVMEIAHIIAGYTLEEADMIRIAMSKKKTEIMDELREPFIRKAIEKGYTADIAKDIFFLIEKFAGYGFNKSHAAAYSFLSYYTAYLKVHYPLEYMVSLLNNEDHLSDKIKLFVRECRRFKIDFIPSIINDFSVKYEIKDKKIKIGLTALKNFGEKLSCAIHDEFIKNGKYETMIDFVARNIDNHLNKNNFESLVKSGFFDKMYKSRQIILDNINLIFDKAEHLNHTKKTKMLDLFSDDDTISNDDEFLKKLNDTDENDNINNIVYEKESLGYYYSNNPLHEYKNEYKYFSNYNYNVEELKTIQTICLIVSLEDKKTANNNEYLEGNLMLKDNTFKYYIWSNTYHTVRNIIFENSIFYIEGYYDKKYESIIIRDLLTIDDLYNNKIKEINIFLNYEDKNEEKVVDLKKFFDPLKSGNVHINIIVQTDNKQKIKISINETKLFCRKDLINLLDIIDNYNINIVI